MSAAESDPQQQKRIEQNIQRTVGKRALREIREIVDEELRVEAAKARILRALVKYGWIILLPVLVLLVYLLGVR